MQTTPAPTQTKDTKPSKPGRKPKVAPSEPAVQSVGKFFIGEIKDGVPVIQKEVTEAEALLDCIKTGRPFLSVQVWKTVSEFEGNKMVFVKVPA